MPEFIAVETFADWRDAARQLIQRGVDPTEIHWTQSNHQPSLFNLANLDQEFSRSNTTFTVPRDFIELARQVACHRDRSRWEVLYRTLWRITHGERDLLDLVTDDDVGSLLRMCKQVSRDVHKMKAFVRFRKVDDESNDPMYIAWHRPDHRIVRLAAPFFARRFQAMNWTILTPDESVTWDQASLAYGDGVPASAAPDEDQLEDLWRTYYQSIFNPARVKVKAMKREMPVRHWATLPETTTIDDLLRQAPARVAAMAGQSEGFRQTAIDYLPSELDWDHLRHAAAGCRACHLHGPATQTVFGSGPVDAEIMLVGEQPGDREDIIGEPFVGPAGKLLDQALAGAGIDRPSIYVTNVVKHFKFVQSDSHRSGSSTARQGKRRLHQKPDSREIFACRPWLEAEIATVRPHAIVCLGATAAQALFGRDFRITQNRGQVLPTEWCERTIATWHPAAVLRMPDRNRRDQMVSQLGDDLGLARQGRS